jgi:hybrid polyketide synthase/nonribosomal peptide synthetase ACE1
LKENHGGIHPNDLAWTLHARRSHLSTKVAIAALSTEQLGLKIDEILASAEQDASTAVGLRSIPNTGTPRLLGVFTGQGAQWATMGSHLIRSSSFVQEQLSALQDSLDTLPQDDRPTWRLKDELLAPADSSRLGEAALSQPLCTAIQVILVDMLRAAGVTFAAVVGHSSGEIAAAYTAGFLTASDAIRVAYYRGLYAYLARNTNNQQKGAMLAVGASWEEAQQLVSSPDFKGRLAVAAHNSPASITLSGDADATMEAKAYFEGQKKFARLLKVDTAYHSHHMEPCGDRYVEALRACGVQVQRPQTDTSCTWFSSVTASSQGMQAVDALRDEYWRDNMTNAVLFAEAVKNAVTNIQQLDLAIEIGPHPALQGPATQNIAEVHPSPVPYCGVLSRGKNDSEAFTNALGFIWTRLPQMVDFKSFENVTLGATSQPKMVVGLPSYQWSHGRAHWAESRISKRLRTRNTPHHEVLGFLSPDSNAYEMRWSNVLKQKEIPWLSGHQLQGMTVFPAAGYVAMALEASRALIGDQSISLIELHELTIPRAITFDENDDLGVETLVSLTAIVRHSDQLYTANFACYSIPVLGLGADHDMELSASGTVKISLGAPDIAALAYVPHEIYNMGAVDSDRFYSAIAELGYNYSGQFRTLSSAQRKLNQASALVASYVYDEMSVSEYLVHPSMLDVAFQASILAYSAPGDGRLWSLSVPTAIGTIRVNPEVCAALPTSGSSVPVLATIDGESEKFSASIDIYSDDSENVMMQVEDLKMRPFAPANEADDRVMFTNTKYGVAMPDSASLQSDLHPSAYDAEVAAVCERISFYYLHKWNSELAEHSTRDRSGLALLSGWLHQSLSVVARSQQSAAKNEWTSDSSEDISALASTYADSVDVKMLLAFDESMQVIIQGTTAPQDKHQLPIVHDWHQSGLGSSAYNSFLAATLKQIVYRYPHARILELGAGTGAATQSVLQAVGHTCSSYTYTDASQENVRNAGESFRSYSEKMTYKLLDITSPPADQGFKSQGYDVVIASHLPTVAGSIATTLEHVRQLLKPGGFLIVKEFTTPSSLRSQVIAGALLTPGSDIDGGSFSPLILSPGAWHSALRKVGFSGVDARTGDIDNTVWPMSVIVSQAVDERVQFLRRPLSAPSPSASPPFEIESLVILGNGTPETAQIGEAIADHLERFCSNITVLGGLPSEEESMDLNPMSTFVNLVDLDSPIFRNITDEDMLGLNRMLELAKNIVWVTHGGRDSPYQMASIAFGRSVREEALHINFSHIDISGLQHNVSQIIAEYLVQQCVLDEWEAPPSALADPQHQDSAFLWSREPEVFFDGGQLKVPRLIPQSNQNARLNSLKRSITKKVPVPGSNVGVISPVSESRRYVVEQPHQNREHASGDIFRVQSSSLKALSISSDMFLFLGIGHNEAKGTCFLLSTSNSCEIAPLATATVPQSLIDQDYSATGNEILVAVASELLAEALTRQLSQGDHIMIHCSGADWNLAEPIRRLAAERSVIVTLTQADTKNKTPTSIDLNPRISNMNLRKILARVKPTHFLDLTASFLGDRITHALNPNCTVVSASTLFRSNSSLPPSPSDTDTIAHSLKDSVLRSKSLDRDLGHLVIPLPAVRSLEEEYALNVIHWPSDELVEAEVHPLDNRQLFAKDKTYLLVGLSGQIGQSLCEWMVANGAGCVCLTSRRPKVDERWLRSFDGTGASVKVIPMDVLDPTSIERVVKEIRATCAPIAGVANGAVIFDDQLFANMPGESMRRVLAPKVDGSMNLDKVFHDTKLDFFILFSSVVCIYGNAGQSNYSAANGFLNALAVQRRKRGLAASSIALGMVAGIGHAENAGEAVQEQLVKRIGLPPVSETDLRQIFAEAIIAGSQPSQDPVVVAGLRAISDDEDLRGPWFSNPYFSHMIRESRRASDSGDDKKTTLPVSQLLAKCATKGEAIEILRESFATKLAAMLQLGDQKIEHDAPLLELGIDSLFAGEVRSWFLKELKVDIPVLKVVGGASLSELCERALEELPSFEKQDVAETGKTTTTTTAAKPSESKLEVPSKAQSSDEESDPASASDSRNPPTTMTTPSGSVPDLDSKATETLELRRKVRDNRKFLKSERISLPQSRFWFLRHLLEDPTTPNVVISYQMVGNLRIGKLERAIRLVTNRHEALRTCFVEDDTLPGEAYQSVIPSSPLRLERKKIDSVEDIGPELEAIGRHVFDLEHGDVMKLVLLTLSSSSHYLLINYHHIVMDGASWNVFFSDLEKAYLGQSLGPSPRQYPDFSVAQRRAIDNGDMLDELQFWKTIFPAYDPPPVLPLLPMAKTSSRVAMEGFDTHQVSCHLEPALIARVKAVSKAQRSTPFHLHLAAFKAMLFLLAGEDTRDLTIGFADAARNDSSVERSIGFFLNLLTLRFRRNPTQSFAEAIGEARTTAHAALESSRLPFDVLLSELNVARSSLHSPFFQAFLDYRQGVQERHPWGNCQAELQDVRPGRTAYDITLDVTDSNTDSRIVFRVQKSLYDLTAANLFLDTYVQFLDTVTSQPSLSLVDTPLFSQTQLERSTQIGRGRSLQSDWLATLPHRIHEVAMKNQDRVALMDGTGQEFTYKTMDSRIDAISEALQHTGIGKGSRVLVYQQPAADWTCSMLAIMRIGAVYIPMNLREPTSRLAAVAKDCEPRAILADNTTIEEAPSLRINGLCAVINVSDLPFEASVPVPIVAEADSVAAILYTSGSTGTPKGISVTHAGLRNEIEGYTKTWGLGAERALQQSAFTFNHSSDQMYTGLVNGGMVYIVPSEKRGDPIEIAKIIQEHRITYTKATPSEYSMWIQFGGEPLRQASSWRYAFGGGENLTTIVTDEFASLNLPHLRFFNSYGPTEISISSHKIEILYREKEAVKRMGRIPCGYSLPNYYTYILDEQLQPVPVGMPGEIYLGGAGVSLGYLNNKELTNKHFIPNPFVTSDDVARGWTRMYRTGDIGHLQADGAMVFHSRMAGDSQVKIRGLRIELSDIESNLITTAQGSLREAVVTLREGDPSFLVAHVVFSQQHNVPDKDAFLQNLLGRLPIPQYMIPTMAIPLPKFPLNNHSKVDRKAVQNMPLPERTGRSKSAVEMTETMVQLERIWRDVIGTNSDKLDVEPSTNFFLVGGNSLLVIRLQARIREIFQVVIPLFKLMGASTLADMARNIEESSSVRHIDWEKETTPPSIPSFLQPLPTKAKSSFLTIMLTGATGFLGKYILPQLASRGDVQMIHCVAVRDKPRQGELFTSPKVTYHVGDLSSPMLGLSVEEFRRLSSEVDVVLHMGAVRSFWDNYHVLRPSNVESMKEIVNLAAPRHVPIHFISTVGVLPADEEPTVQNAGTAAAYPPSREGSDGYVASKWAGERILERSVETLGVPSRIYRFLPAAGRDDTQQQDLMDSFVNMVDALGSIPDMGVWNGRVDMIPAEQIALWLGESVMAVTASVSDEELGPSTRFLHYQSELSFHTDELSDYIERKRGDRANLETVPFLSWLGRCKAIGFNYLIASQQATVTDGERGVAYISRR